VGFGTGQVLEEVGEVGVRLQAVGLCGLDQAVEQRAGLGTGAASEARRPALRARLRRTAPIGSPARDRRMTRAVGVMIKAYPPYFCVNILTISAACGLS
jgi:hypothetical protein